MTMNIGRLKTWRVYENLREDSPYKDVKAHSVGYDDFGGLVFLVNKPGLVTPENPQGVEIAKQTYTFRTFAYFVDLENEAV